jgi:hypothetical protein
MNIFFETNKNKKGKKKEQQNMMLGTLNHDGTRQRGFHD